VCDSSIIKEIKDIPSDKSKTGQMQITLHKLIFILSIALITCISTKVNAQCTNRYLDTIFPAVDSFENIAYTTSSGGVAGDTLLMDIYQPVGDTACQRHLAIWVHGGAFVGGTKNDGDVQFLCERFARRGYVCATINYRLASSIVALYDSIQIFKYAMYAASDLKAAIRYFYKDAGLTNHWNIDTNSIFIGGSSAGGIAADFAATLDSLNQIASVFLPTVTAMGGLDGNSGNAGYSTKIIGVASLAGAVNTTDWIKPGDPPMVMCQGTADGTIPYDCAQALHQYTFGFIPTIIDFCGSGAMAPALDNAGVMNSLLPFPGSGHVPWDTNTVIENRMDSAVAAFYYQVKCTQAAGHCNEPSGIRDIASSVLLKVFPNPANDHIQVLVLDQNELSAIALYDYTGREIFHNKATGKSSTVNVSNLSPGIYTIQVYVRDQNNYTITKKITIE
jgi:para-nitrobenzyl esterase